MEKAEVDSKTKEDAMNAIKADLLDENSYLYDRCFGEWQAVKEQELRLAAARQECERKDPFPLESVR